MATNQEGKQASFRAISGTALDYNGDALAAFQAEGATATDYTGAFIEWLQIRTGSSQTNVDDLAALFASQNSFASWSDVDTISALP